MTETGHGRAHLAALRSSRVLSANAMEALLESWVSKIASHFFLPTVNGRMADWKNFPLLDASRNALHFSS